MGAVSYDDDSLDLAILTWVLDHGAAGVEQSRVAAAFSDVDWARRLRDMAAWELLQLDGGWVVPTPAAIRAGQILG